MIYNDSNFGSPLDIFVKSYVTLWRLKFNLVAFNANHIICNLRSLFFFFFLWTMKQRLLNILSILSLSSTLNNTVGFSPLLIARIIYCLENLFLRKGSTCSEPLGNIHEWGPVVKSFVQGPGQWWKRVVTAAYNSSKFRRRVTSRN